MEILDPIQNRIIVRLIVCRGFNNLKEQEVVLYILRGEVVDILYDQERRQYKAVAVHIFNRYCLFPITKLKLLASATSICACNHHIAADNPHHKARFVEVIKVLVLDTVLRTHVDHQPEPHVYKVGVFAESSLEIVHT